MTRTLLIVGASALAMMSAHAAQAGEEAAVSEIVVTAQKRTEKLQDVPVAVSVVSGEAIAAKGSVNLEGAQYLVPSLNFRKSGTTINQSLFLRGVGTSTFSIAGEPSISTVVDGVVYSRAGEARPTMRNTTTSRPTIPTRWPAFWSPALQTPGRSRPAVASLT